MRRRLCAMLLAAAFASPLAAQDADGQARRILDQPQYKGYRIDRPAAPQGWPGQADGEAGGDAGSEAGRPPRRSGRIRPRGAPDSQEGSIPRGSGPDLSGLSILGPVLEVLFWIVIALAALGGLILLVKALLGLKLDRRKRPAKSQRKKPQTQQAHSHAPEPPQPAQDELEDALARALRDYEAALQAGDFGRAAVQAYRVFWLRAGWTGCVEDSDVRTWRDALRMVREVDKRQSVRDALRLVEKVRYGAHAPDRAEFEQWRAGLDRLNPQEALR